MLSFLCAYCPIIFSLFVVLLFLSKSRPSLGHKLIREEMDLLWACMPGEDKTEVKSIQGMKISDTTIMTKYKPSINEYPCHNQENRCFTMTQENIESQKRITQFLCLESQSKPRMVYSKDSQIKEYLVE